jgi:hypothetical protein
LGARPSVSGGAAKQGDKQDEPLALPQDARLLHDLSSGDRWCWRGLVDFGVGAQGCDNRFVDDAVMFDASSSVSGLTGGAANGQER